MSLINKNGLEVPVEDISFSGIYRQAITNSNFDVWQRGTTIALTTANGYSADMWYLETATAGDDKTATRQDGSGVSGSTYCARIQRPNAQTTVTPRVLSQALEIDESIKFRGRYLTLSFWARKGANYSEANSELLADIYGGKGTTEEKLSSFTGLTVLASTKHAVLTTSWQKFTLTTSAATPSDIKQIGIKFTFIPVGTAGATDYFEVTQVQLSAGQNALDYSPKSYAQELQDCQRFFQRFGLDVLYARVGWGLSFNTTQASIDVSLPVRMRAIPVYAGSLTLSMVNGFSGYVCSNIEVYAYATSRGYISLIGTSSGLTSGQPQFQFQVDGTQDVNIFAVSAEF